MKAEHIITEIFDQNEMILPRVCCKLRRLSVEVVYWCTGGRGRLWSGSCDVWRSAMKAKTDKTVFTCKLLLTAFCQIKSLSCKMKFILEEAALEKRMGWAKNWQFGGSDDCSRHNRGFCHQTFPNRRRISVAVYSRKEILKIGNKSWHKLWLSGCNRIGGQRAVVVSSLSMVSLERLMYSTV